MSPKFDDLRKWKGSEVPDSELKRLLPAAAWQELQSAKNGRQSGDASLIAEEFDNLERGSGTCTKKTPPAALFLVVYPDGLKVYLCGHNPSHATAV